ncbi:MAG: hypothetical protein Kow0031_02580 [Anaerolineae bacterium]
MPKNNRLFNFIIAAGRQAGLAVDHESIKERQPAAAEYGSSLTDLVFFTLRPRKEYYHDFRPSWTDLRIRAVAVGEDEDDLGTALVFEAQYGLTIITSTLSDDATIVMDDLLDRIVDFRNSFPAEAGRLFVVPFQWEMTMQGEIILEPEMDAPFCDYDMCPTLTIHVEVIEFATVDQFNQALANLSAGTAMGREIEAMLERLALLFQWLDTETPPPLPGLGGIYH